MGRFSQALLEDANFADTSASRDVVQVNIQPELVVDKAETPPSIVENNTPKSAPPVDSGNVWLETKIKLHTRLIDEIDLAQLDGLESDELREKVHGIVSVMAREDKLKMNAADLRRLGDGVYDEMVGLGPLEVLLQDETVSDILINGHERVFVERGGELELSAVRFANEPHLLPNYCLPFGWYFFLLFGVTSSQLFCHKSLLHVVC